MRRTFLERLRGRPTVFKVAMSVFLTIYCLLTLYLILVVMLSSFKTRTDLLHNIMGPPRSFTLSNFHKVIMVDGFLRFLLNSVVLTSASVTALLFVSSLTAYGLSRYHFRGRNFLQLYFLLGTMFPIQLGILPIFVIIRTLHLTNNFVGLILIYAANMSVAVFIMSKFFRSLPHSIYESAKIDGAGEFRTFFQVMLPMGRPAVIAVAIIHFVLIWNDFYIPLVFLTRKAVRTLTLGVFFYMSDFLANWHYVFTAVTVALLPVIILFFLLSEQLVAGLTAGSLKQ